MRELNSGELILVLGESEMVESMSEEELDPRDTVRSSISPRKNTRRRYSLVVDSTEMQSVQPILVVTTREINPPPIPLAILAPQECICSLELSIVHETQEGSVPPRFGIRFKLQLVRDL